MDALIIAGPTAAGKTALALEVAKLIPCEIINMDSALVYRGMDIGTAKPSLTERIQVPHHLIDIIDPGESYSAADFVKDVEMLIPQIKARGNLPIVVGGTMLYLHSWVNGLSDLPSADEVIRERLQAEWLKNPLAMHQRLCDADPIAGKRIHPNDPQRILRALEVLMTNSNLTASLPSMRSVGYRQAWQYLQGDITEPQLHEQALSATRSLAKRQLTWMKKMTCDLLLAANLPLSKQLHQIMPLLGNDKISQLV